MTQPPLFVLPRAARRILRHLLTFTLKPGKIAEIICSLEVRGVDGVIALPPASTGARSWHGADLHLATLHSGGRQMAEFDFGK